MVFGVGGAEWIVIALVALGLFAPGLLLFWLGYLTGKNAGVRRTLDGVASIAPEIADEAPASVPLGDEAASPGDPDA